MSVKFSETTNEGLSRKIIEFVLICQPLKTNHFAFNATSKLTRRRSPFLVVLHKGRLGWESMIVMISSQDNSKLFPLASLSQRSTTVHCRNELSRTIHPVLLPSLCPNGSYYCSKMALSQLCLNGAPLRRQEIDALRAVLDASGIPVPGTTPTKGTPTRGTPTKGTPKKVPKVTIELLSIQCSDVVICTTFLSLGFDGHPRKGSLIGGYVSVCGE